MSPQDWISIIGAISAATVAIITALGAVYAQVRATHRLVDGRMSELLALTRKSATAEGRLESAGG